MKKPAAQIISLSERRDAKRGIAPKPASSVVTPFSPSLYPGNDFHRLGQLLDEMADWVRDGRLSKAVTEMALRGFSASAFAACETVRNFEQATIVRERERAAKKAGRAKRKRTLAGC